MTAPTSHAPAPLGHIAQRTHYFPVRVHFEDVDMTRVVHHPTYLYYLERARSNALYALGIDHKAAQDAGMGYFAIAQLAIRYRQPARFEDALLIESQIYDLRAASWFVHQRVMRDEQLLADADLQIVFLSPEGRPKRQPAGWAAAYHAIARD